MLRKILAVSVVLVANAVSSSAAPAPAATPAASGSETGWHTVRPGDKLETLAAFYLGSQDRWPELWRLNPEIANPHRIEPGQIVRVPVRRPLPASIARLRTVEKKVEAEPAPIPWRQALQDDLLRQRDGVRTYAASSAEIEFGDGVRATLSENSLVFLRSRELAGGRTGKVLAVDGGQADVDVEASTAVGREEIEIVLGATSAKPKGSSPGGASRTRARKASDGAAKVMAYTGSAAVAAAGATVELTEGTGTSVSTTAAPTPPEALLAAPAATAPALGVELAYGNPTFAWLPVAGAASYVFELCLDASCTRLARREPDLAQPTYTPDRLAAGSYFWRVTAISSSGLDGYPSPGRALVVANDRVDRAAPSGAIRLVGSTVKLGDELLVGSDGRVEGTFSDPDGGAVGVRFRVDGGEVAESAWRSGWTSGAHRFDAVVRDAAGNQAEVAGVAVTVDVDPPQIRWELVEKAELAGDPADRTGSWWRPDRKRHDLELGGFSWSPDGDSWFGPRQTPAFWELSAETTRGHRAPTAFLKFRRSLPIEAGRPAGEGGVVRVWVEDQHSSVGRVGIRLVAPQGLDAANGVRIEATDLLGNRSVLTFNVPR